MSTLPPVPPPPPSSNPPAVFRSCYRHDDRTAGVICQRCDRPICPDCMHQAAVGFHCPECAKAGRQQVRRVRAASRVTSVPVASIALIAINVAVFVVGMGMRGGIARQDALGGLITEGILDQKVVGVAHGQWWRVVTAGFLHLNLLHIASNMLALYVLGMLCERMVGRWRFVLVYFVSLLAGSFGALLVTPNTLTVGASGAIFGLFGLLLVGARAGGIDLRRTGLVQLLVINLIFTFAWSGVSIGGHIGGLVGGTVAAAALIELPRRLPSGSRATRLTVGTVACAAIGLICLYGSLAVAANHARL